MTESNPGGCSCDGYTLSIGGPHDPMCPVKRAIDAESWTAASAANLDEDRRRDLDDAVNALASMVDSGSAMSYIIERWPGLAHGIDRVTRFADPPVDVYSHRATACGDRPAPDDWMAWRMRFYAAFTRTETTRRGFGLFNVWRTPDAPEADRMAAAAAKVVADALRGTDPDR